MTLQDLIDQLGLTVLTRPVDFNAIEPTTGYASDLLSCVMAGAKNRGVWLTLQAHANIIAVAALLELSAIIITEGTQPDASVISKADEQSIPLLSTPESTYALAGKLWAMGLRDQ